LDKVFIHLHVTGRAPDKDACGYIFREALRRQNEIDRKAFKELLQERGLQQLLGPSLPMCWVNGAREDIMWSHTLALTSAKLNANLPQMMGKRVANHTETASVPLSDQSTASFADSLALVDGRGEALFMVPVIFGRPDFATEIRSIGKARPGYNVHLYACANDTVVQGLQDVADVCNLHAQADSEANGTPPQKYILHFERFG